MGGKILGGIHHLAEETVEPFMALLRTAPAGVQEKLLDSTSWLWRRLPWNSEERQALEAQGEAWLEVVWALGQSEQKGVRSAALATLGHWPWEPAVYLPRLLAQEGWPSDELEALAYAESLARGGGRLVVDDPLRLTIVAQLQEAMPHPAAVAGLVRLTVMPIQLLPSDTWKRVTPAEHLTSLPALREAVHREGLLPATALLTGLLAAGTDDDGWGKYHEAIAHLVAALVQEEEGLLAELLAALQTALAGDSWQARRIALAAIAQCAAAMPDALNLREAETAGLLVQSTRDAGSFTARRQGITALSHLSTLTPAILDTLLTASYDVPIVQQDALAAIPRFRQLGAGFAHEEALATLEAALLGESGAAAYMAAQLLGALGQSPTLVSQPALREGIAGLLARAWGHGRARETVYLLDEDGNIEEKGTRAQAILAALLQVRGVPGG